MRSLKLLTLFTVLFIASHLFSDEPQEAKLVPWVMDESYNGPNSDSFNKLRYEVPILMRQTLIDLSVRCGLDFREGWQMPMMVRFVDGAPMGVESVLAYVHLEQDSRGNLQQSLNVNLAAYGAEHFNFDRVFAHELVHAMLNDSLGGQSTDLPVWFHEGLAVYGANQGEKMVAAYVARFPHASSSYFINGLEGPHGALDYAEDYLAFKYVHDQHGVNSLQGLIREIIRRKGDVPGSIEFSCFENWETFKENALKFAEEEVSRLARQRMTPTSETKPY